MGKVTILEQWTMKDPLNCIGYSMAVCYGTPTETEKNIKRAKTHFESHGRLQEMPDIYMILDGYSAKCLRELYTHIGGSPTRMQASTRYIDYSEGFDSVLPNTVANSDAAKEIWENTNTMIAEAMSKLKDLGIPKEDFSNLLPLAYESKMIWKVNCRTLINFMNMRLCTRAYWEIRQLAKDIKKALSSYSDEWKYICDNMFVAKCEAVGYCTEHSCCGKRKKKESILNEK